MFPMLKDATLKIGSPFVLLTSGHTQGWNRLVGIPEFSLPPITQSLLPLPTNMLYVKVKQTSHSNM
jgi:hypothetical protein